MNSEFAAGVVEGFYGLPWTSEQRKILFGWMQKMGLNTYMYAPKDDYKHRACWRELYSVEEADNLTSLIESAHQKGVSFVYAISPGLDITFSSAKDVQALKRKLEQVAAFGCQAFSILFDDIDPELSDVDQSVFASSACAQVSLVNDLYQHLSQPKFFFCPTEYCASRARPSVLSSEYLNTIGTKLLPGIEVLWTGCKVISKNITIQTLEDITTALRRAPVIWDNIHANDYDPRRVFLGPYDGRSSDILPYIRGVLTNPNCEFETNFIACHTLGQWCKSNPDGVKKDIIASERLSPVAADIKLETESDLGSDDDLPLYMGKHYKPRQALKVAMSEWITELTTVRDPPKRRLPAAVLPAALLAPVVSNSTVIVSTPISAACAAASLATGSVLDSLAVQIVPEGVVANPSFLQPLSQPVNSLALDSSSDVSDSLSDSGSETEPMDGVQSSSVVLVPSNLNTLPKASTTDRLMQLDLEGRENTIKLESTIVIEVPENCDSSRNHISSLTPTSVTIKDLMLLVDLFYLPFEHGSSSLQFLQNLHWLVTNAHCVQEPNRRNPEGKEWLKKEKEFEKSVLELDTLLARLLVGPNKSLLCDIYSYLWDMRGLFIICLNFVKWLELGLVCNTTALINSGFATWFSKGYKEAFTSGDQEPWVFRGGLQAELQRLLPISAAHDLFMLKPPDYIITELYNFRPYQPQDKTTVYDICLKTCDDGMDGSNIFCGVPSLLGDRLVGNFLAYSPEFCFVAEDSESICGYILASVNAKELASKSNNLWVPAMKEKYPRPEREDFSPSDEVILSFYNETLDVKDEVAQCYPSVLRLDVLTHRILDPAIPRRLLACAMCVLKAAGSHGVHTKLNISDKYLVDFYAKLGFFSITTSDGPDDIIYMGRLI